MNTTKRAAIWLCEAEIGGRLLCRDTVIDGGGERSVQADRMRVGGNVRLLQRFTARGEIRLVGARIGVSLDLIGVRIESPLTGLALDLDEAVIDGSVFLMSDAAGRRAGIYGRIDMGRARIGGQFLIRNATLEARSDVPTSGVYTRSRTLGTVLSGPRLSVGADVSMDDSCRVLGGIDLAISDIGSLSIGPGCTLNAPGHTALDLTKAEIRAVLRLDGQATVQGTMRLAGAVVHGTLALHGQISHPEDRSLIGGSAMAVDGDVYLDGLRADGGGQFP